MVYSQQALSVQAVTAASTNRKSNEQKSSEYLLLNPTGRVPTPVDNGLVIFEKFTSKNYKKSAQSLSAYFLEQWIPKSMPYLIGYGCAVNLDTNRLTHGATIATVGNAIGQVVAQLFNHCIANSEWKPCEVASTKADTMQTIMADRIALNRMGAKRAGMRMLLSCNF